MFFIAGPKTKRIRRASIENGGIGKPIAKTSFEKPLDSDENRYVKDGENEVGQSSTAMRIKA